MVPDAAYKHNGHKSYLGLTSSRMASLVILYITSGSQLAQLLDLLSMYGSRHLLTDTGLIGDDSVSYFVQDAVNNPISHGSVFQYLQLQQYFFIPHHPILGALLSCFSSPFMPNSGMFLSYFILIFISYFAVCS